MAVRILKLLCVFFSMVMILLCGCAPKGTENAPPVTGFKADFSAEYHGLRLSGTLTYPRRGVCAMRLTAPKTLEGLCIRFQNNTVALLRGDAAATADEPYFPADSFPKLVFTALQADGGDGSLQRDGSGIPQLLCLPDGSAVTFFNGEALD